MFRLKNIIYGLKIRLYECIKMNKLSEPMTQSAKQAKSVIMKAYYVRNAERIKAQRRERYIAQKKEWVEKPPNEQEAIRVKQRIASKKSYNKNEESRKKQMKLYYEANAEQLKIKRQARYQKAKAKAAAEAAAAAISV